MADETREGERIAKLLARAGVASRREVERMIAEGRVAVGGTVLETAATVLPSLRGVTVDGKPVARPERTRLFRFHKPAGLITAEHDPAGRPTIYAALRNALPEDAPRVMPVGRLDFSTEGLLLMTNDGAVKRLLELPATGVPRTYRARAFGEVSQTQLEELIHGITIEGVRYGRINANLERRTGRNQWVEMTLTEGKNREVRRVLEHLGLQVSRLIRVAYGPFTIAGLPRGGADEVRKEDLQRFLSSLKHDGVGLSGGADDEPTGDDSAPVRQAPRAAERRPARAAGRSPGSAREAGERASAEARAARKGGAPRQRASETAPRGERPARASRRIEPGERKQSGPARRASDRAGADRRGKGERPRRDAERPGGESRAEGEGGRTGKRSSPAKLSARARANQGEGQAAGKPPRRFAKRSPAEERGRGDAAAPSRRTGGRSAETATKEPGPRGERPRAGPAGKPRSGRPAPRSPRPPKGRGR
jgi:23S rRNA pseudouridine2605 synthase